MAFENIVGNGEDDGNQHFLLFAQGFLPCHHKDPKFEPHLSSANSSELK